MVGIVIVSHSKELAAGVLALAEQMAQGQVAMAAAGGIDDPEHPIGTDPMKVLGAIESVYSPDGVVVLMDLGSALLSAETAVEFLEPDQQENVFLCAAPLVEGAVAAVVQAAAGSTAAQVIAEARSALTAKLSQLGQLEPTEFQEPDHKPEPAATGHQATIHLTIQNPHGLHARPAAKLVGAANRFAAEITISKGNKTANVKSINQVATLGVRRGDQIQLTATGEDADAALSAIQALAADNFGELDIEEASVVPEPAVIPENSAAGLTGIPASPGIAIGPVFQYQPQIPEISPRQAQDINHEWAWLETAVQKAQAELQSVIRQMTAQVGAAKAEIFEAHRLVLQDPDLLAAAKKMISEQEVIAAYAWQQAIEQTAARYRAMDDAYMQARAADVLDAGGRVIRNLVDFELPTLAVEAPVILVASDLTPSDTAELDPDKILGILTELGGATAHSAILARALGIPAVVGLGPAVEELKPEEIIALDGSKGLVYTNLDPEKTAELETQRQEWLATRQQAQAKGQEAAITLDGHQVEIVANIGGPHDAALALNYGAEGVGLFRTEFLFLGRENAPTEAEQLAAYKQIAETMGQRPLIIRTLDIGGDKPLPYLKQEEEANPFLGLRGIRFCLANPEILKTQLRAILQASPGHNIKIMFPMVGTMGEIRAAKEILLEVQAELKTAAIAFDETIEIGMMIEVPSAVAIADQLAQEADFFSIGTNDLTQYVMAADRGNAKVADLVNAFNPAVLRMIHQTVEAAHTAGIWVGLCGELGGKPEAAPILIGLGLDELSMNAPSIPAVKAAIRQLNKSDAQQLANKALALESADQILEQIDSPAT